ncbi:MAG: hypothetical protein AAF495_06430 [Pseudomonadota bacterium]
MFARFEVPHAEMLQAAQDLCQGEEVSGAKEAELSTLIDWFEEALESPAEDGGLAWFKASASQHLDQAHDLAALLETMGHRVTMITTEDPGEILYEDDHQVVANGAAA